MGFFLIYSWLAIKVAHRALDFINEVPSGIMKWIGGGHDPLDANVGQQGNSFIGGVINKGEGSAQAAGAAGKGLKDKARSQKMADEGKKADVANNERLISAISGSKNGLPPASNSKASDT